MEAGVIATLIAARVPIFLAIVGGIIWIVREFGEINSGWSLLEQSVKHLKDSPVYQGPVRPDQVEQIEGFEIRILTNKSET